MNRPPRPHMMGNMYRSPRPFNNRWRPRVPHPATGFQCGPNTNYRPPFMNQNKDNSEEHWCETCDRGFPTPDLLDKHRQQHQKCNIDGCQFVAHPKVITKHIQMQHSSGLYKKIAKLDNPEEINKWREERKKKYPTRTNIEKKEAQCREKIERGEKMALKRDKKDSHNSSNDQEKGIKRSFDRRDRNHRTNGPNFNQKQNHVANLKNQPPPKKVPKLTPKVPLVVEKNKLKPFAGILSIAMDDYNDKTEDVCDTAGDDNNILIEDDPYEETILNKCPKAESAQEPVLCGALISLICDYGSSDEETNEKENQVSSNQKTKNNLDKSNLETDFENMTDNVMKSEIIINEEKPKDGASVNKDSLKKDVEQEVETIDNNNTENSDDDSPEEIKAIKSTVQDTNQDQEHLTKNIEDGASVNKDSLKKDVEQEVETIDNNNTENSDDDSPEEIKTIKNTVQDTNQDQEDLTKNIITQVSLKKNPPVRHNQRPINRYKHKLPSTLLYKLLHKEIRQERNIVLQCIRYIKRMNYFEEPSN